MKIGLLMKALRFMELGKAPEMVEIPVPTPGPGEILVKVKAAGVCHSDISVMEYIAAAMKYNLPMTLGHEGVGEVVELGAGVSEAEVKLHENVAIYGPWGCGTCLNCASGKENYCLLGKSSFAAPGLGRDGTMAEYALIDDKRHIVPIGDLDPVKTVPLTDAGLTPYNAIKPVLPKLTPGSTAVVIGVGGLGHLAIQFLKQFSSAQVIALDVSEDKLKIAKELGADLAFLSTDKEVADKVKSNTNYGGATAVFDFVGIPATTSLSPQLVMVRGDIVLVGIGKGAIEVGFGKIPFDVGVKTPYWGSRDELIELIKFAKNGSLEVHTQVYSLEQAPQAYQDLAAGKVAGRAVIVP